MSGAQSRKIGFLLALSAALLWSASWSPASASGLQITYLANAGFLLDDGKHKVLIDALFGDGLRGYPKVPEPTRSRLEAANSPFDDIDLVLVTHHHGDHFDAAAGGGFLVASPSTVLVSTPQVIGRLKRESVWPQISDQARAVFPDEGTIETLVVNGLDLKVLNLHHGRSRRPQVENLGFLVELGGNRVLHIGDTEVDRNDVAALDLPALDVGIGLLTTWFLSYQHWADVVSQEISPEHIIGMHMSTRDAPPSFYGPDGSYERRLEKIEQTFPQARVMTVPGAVLRFP